MPDIKSLIYPVTVFLLVVFIVAVALYLRLLIIRTTEYSKVRKAFSITKNGDWLILNHNGRTYNLRYRKWGLPVIDGIFQLDILLSKLEYISCKALAEGYTTAQYFHTLYEDTNPITLCGEFIFEIYAFYRPGGKPLILQVVKRQRPAHSSVDDMVLEYPSRRSFRRMVKKYRIPLHAVPETPIVDFVAKYLGPELPGLRHNEEKVAKHTRYVKKES